MLALRASLSRSPLVRPLGRASSGPRPRVLHRAALAAALVIASFGAIVPSALAAPTSMVDLGDAATYAVLSGASVGNTVSAPGAPHTTLRGDLGVKAAAQPTGFPPGVVTGTSRVGTAAAAAAHADLVAAYDEVAARPAGAALAGALAGTTITPGLHTVAGAVSNTTTVTLDGGGNPNAVFVFQINGAMAMAAGSKVVLANGAQASRVFWQVNGAGAVGANAEFAGTLMASAAVAVGNGTIFNGRAMARDGALTLDNNQVYSAPPVVTIAGGAVATTTDTTPTIGGTTDVESPGVVTVTVAGQTLSATPGDGAWSVTSAILANDAYPVVASVTDGAGNPGSATQQLTVDTVLPVVSIEGGASVTTNDPTPTITGTSDVATGTVVRVSIGAQSRTTLVQSDGTWDVTSSALTDATRTVTASVSDLASNEGTDSQALTIDTAVPAVLIAGGAADLTNDPTPEITGTADVEPGTTVTVYVANETLTGLVGAGGAWSVTAAALADGPHRLAMRVSDAAGNRTGFTQTLTVDTVSPRIAISGGATATTSDHDPTITGTSDAATGTTVTVTIGGQSMTTLLQADGTWNTTPSVAGDGAWPVVASAPDHAGNVGSATQTLTIATPAPTASGGAGSTGVTGPAAGGAPAVTPAPATTPFVTPATPPSAAGGPTSAAATTTVARNATQKVAGAALAIATRVTAPAKGSVVVTASGTVKIAGVRKVIRLTTKTTRVPAGKTLTLKLKPRGSKAVAAAASRKIKAALKKGKKVTATITLKISDAAGARRTVKRTVKLKR
ncbi:MAG: ice-binding family protein [Solirubrobacteraceae bacterium]|nr:ice-binding family protein [Solirubrobacteraceae bacterium]